MVKMLQKQKRQMPILPKDPFGTDDPETIEKIARFIRDWKWWVPTNPGTHHDREGSKWTLNDDQSWTDDKGNTRGPEYTPFITVYGPFDMPPGQAEEISRRAQTASFSFVDTERELREADARLSTVSISTLLALIPVIVCISIFDAPALSFIALGISVVSAALIVPNWIKVSQLNKRFPQIVTERVEIEKQVRGASVQ